MGKKLPAFFIFIFLLISFFRSISIAQNVNTDSLENLLKKANGIEKIPYYYTLTDYYSYNETNKAISLANEFLILGEKLDSTNIIENRTIIRSITTSH